MNSGIYAIVHLASGKRYIGSAVWFSRRWAMHRFSLRNNRHHSNKLQNAWNKYGEDAFEFRRLLICDRSDLLFYEQRVLDAYDAVRSGYNICLSARGNIGTKASPEARAKISAALTGIKRSPETRARILAARNTPERIAGMRKALTGRVFSEETRRKISEAITGRVLSPETRERIRQTRLGTTISEETRRRMSAAKIGRLKSEETRAKMSRARRAIEAQKRAAKIAAVNASQAMPSMAA